MPLKASIRRLIPAELQPPPDLLRTALSAVGYFRLRTWLAAHGEVVPDHHLYRPLYCPWDGEPAFDRLYRAIKPYTLVSRDRCHVLWQTLSQSLHLDGDVIECGVFRGGTALLAATTLSGRSPATALELVDSFTGMPDTQGRDRFDRGDFGRTSADEVRKLLAPYPFARVRRGFIPEVFASVQSTRFAWAHVDVDVGQAVADCIAFIYPRLVPGGMMVFDDYGFPSCTRARRAVDEAFAARAEVPLYLPTGQCLVVKLPAEVRP